MANARRPEYGYGLTIWNSRDGSEVLVGRDAARRAARRRLRRLVPRDNGAVAAVYRDDFRVPVSHKGQNFGTKASRPAHGLEPQFEGLAVDQRNGVLYAGQEDVGIWRSPLAKATRAEPRCSSRPRLRKSSIRRSRAYARDVEGLHGLWRGRQRLSDRIEPGQRAWRPAVTRQPFDELRGVLAGRARIDLSAVPHGAGEGRIDAVQESDERRGRLVRPAGLRKAPVLHPRRR